MTAAAFRHPIFDRPDDSLDLEASARRFVDALAAALHQPGVAVTLEGEGESAIAVVDGWDPSMQPTLEGMYDLTAWQEPAVERDDADSLRAWLEWNDSNGDYDGLETRDLRSLWAQGSSRCEGCGGAADFDVAVVEGTTTAACVKCAGAVAKREIDAGRGPVSLDKIR